MELRIRPLRTGTVILGVKILLILIMAAWAASSITQSVNYNGEAGTLNNTNNQLLTTAKGFSATAAASPAGADCGSPIVFGSGTVANTALTGGDVIFDAQVNTTASTPTNSCFTVSFFLSTTIGSETKVGTVAVSTSGTITADQAIDCKFDLGSSAMPIPPFSYRLAVR